MLNTKILSLAVATTMSLGVFAMIPNYAHAENEKPQLVTPVALEAVNEAQNEGVSVVDFGVVADANYYNPKNGNYYKDKSFNTKATDNTEAINKAIKHAKTNNIKNVNIPKGNFLINAEGRKQAYDFEYAVNGGIQLESNINLVMTNETKLVTNTINKPGYSFITINNKENVKVIGGKLVGDMKTHPADTHTYCHGITISHASKNVTIENTEITEMEDDGIMIADYLEDRSGGKKTDNVVIKNVKSNNNGRQGLTISSGTNIKVIDSEFSEQKKHSPMSGIDIELEAYDNMGVKNIEITGNTFSNNAYSGVVVSDSFNDRPLTMSSNVNISNNKLDNNRFGIIASGKVTGLNISNNSVTLDHLVNEFSTGIGSTSEDSKDVTIKDNKVLSENEKNYSLGIINLSPSALISNNTLKGQRKGIVLNSKGAKLKENVVEARVVNVEGQ